MDLALILCMHLEREGYSAASAHSLAEARQKLASERFQAAILDVTLPDGSGLDLLPELDAANTHAVIPSGHRPDGAATVPWLLKPFEQGDLLTALDQGQPAPRPRVLVVEDDSEARQIIRAQLEQLAVEVVTASDGEEALDAFKQRPPDVVLLDVTLPRLDGFQFVAALRRLEACVPLLIYSGRELDERERASLALQETRYLRKTQHSREDLLNSVRELLEISSAPEV